MKHVEAYLSAIEDRESSFDNFGSTEVGASLFMRGKGLITPF